MSKYTTELRYLVESGFDLGLKSYPIFDEVYRDTLNQKIIDHFYMREIGFETAGLFKRMLNIKLNEIMPYYNQMYLSQKIEYDPLETYSIEEVTERTYSNESETAGLAEQTSTGSGTDESKNLVNETPMGSLGNPFSENYATTATQNNDSSTSSSNTATKNSGTDSNSGKDNFKRTSKGRSTGVSQSELLLKYRETFVNIDVMVIDELEPLFMQIW